MTIYHCTEACQLDQLSVSQSPFAYVITMTTEIIPSLTKPPLDFNGGLAKLELTSVTKIAHWLVRLCVQCQYKFTKLVDIPESNRI